MDTDDGRGLEPGTRAEIEAIAQAAQVVDGQDPLDEATRLAIRHRDESELTAWLAPGAGFALLVDEDLSLVVAPDSRREGIGTTLLEHVLEVAGDEPLTAWSHGNHPAASTLAARTGFEPARELWVMRLGRDALAAAVRGGAPGGVPDGTQAVGTAYRIRAYRPEDADELLRVNAAAFASHPEQGAMDAENLAQRMAEPWYDPAGLLVAEGRDGGLAGFHWTKVHPSGEGEVYVVGVDPSAQGTGLGSALTRAGLAHLADVGCEEVILYVEGDNTAAITVYSRLGFTHDPGDTHVQYYRGADDPRGIPGT